MRASYFNPSAFDASLAGRWVGRRFDDDGNTLQLDAFFVLDARIGREIRRGLDAFIAVENLLDEQYEVTRAASGLVRVGTPRFIQAGVRLHIRAD
jgi:iron complex outermembrane receptor protein